MKSDMQKLLKQAVAIQKEIRELEAGKLSAVSFKRDSLAASGVDDATINVLERKLTPDYLGAFGLVRQFQSMIATGGPPRVTSVPPAGSRFYQAYASDRVRADVVELSTTITGLFALAVRRAIKNHPEAFGDVDDWPKHQTRLEDMRKKLEAVKAEIGTAWSMDDLDIQDAHRDGLCRVTFNCTGGAVNLIPLNSLADRLIAWAGQEAEQKAAA